MNKRPVLVALTVFFAVTIALAGCKARQKPIEIQSAEVPESMVTPEELVPPQAPLEPATVRAVETIPPTAALPEPPAAAKPAPAPQEKQDKNKDIQKALKAAGFYTGAIDGMVGPRTKKAILDFQKAKGLKADGIVGPKTWAELEKYLVQ